MGLPRQAILLRNKDAHLDMRIQLYAHVLPTNYTCKNKSNSNDQLLNTLPNDKSIIYIWINNPYP